MGLAGAMSRRATLRWYACWLLAAAFDAAGLVGSWYDAGSGYWAVSSTLSAACLQTAGLLIWRRWPQSPVGLLIYATGLAGMAQFFDSFPNAALLAVGYLAGPLKGILVGHAVLLYPDGRFHRRAERIFVILAYVAAVGIRVPNLLVSQTHWLSQCEVKGDCIDNPFLIQANSPLAYALDNAATIVVAAIVAGFVGMLTYRIRRGGPVVRRAFRPIIVIIGVLVVTFTVGQRNTWTLRHEDIVNITSYAQMAASVALPVAMAYGLSRIGPDVADLVRRLELAPLEERRRLERDLHDGAQQRLIGVGMSIEHARRYVDDPTTLERALDEAAVEVRNTLTELRELTRGLRPTLLAERGLAGAVPVLAQHTHPPVSCDLDIDARLPDHIEAAAYFVISEGLQNVAKHAKATQARVTVVLASDQLRIEIADDGVGGADPRHGSGLRGLADRLATTGGVLTVTSPPGQGTTLRAVIPVSAS
jgi:signal transduction histidine kinase